MVVPGGPSVVAIGGGHGLSASLRAARRYAGEITAVVSVADDGGSSGRLREALPGLPAPGDVRRCLAALAEDDSPFGRILEHRFGDGELAGHALGNLLLVSLAHEMGSFSAAVDEVAARVGAVGRVLPATVDAVALVGIVDGRRGVEPVVGQVAVQNTEGVRRLRLSPDSPASPPDVSRAILAADQVVLGPGSLFTSVLAAAIAPDVREAARHYLPWLIAAPLIGVASWIYDGIFIGALMTREMLRAMFLSVLLYTLAVVALPLAMGNHGLWAALMVLNAARGLTMRAAFPRLFQRVSAGAA